MPWIFIHVSLLHLPFKRMCTFVSKVSTENSSLDWNPNLSLRQIRLLWYFYSDHWLLHSLGILWFLTRQDFTLDLCYHCLNRWFLGLCFLAFEQVRLLWLPTHSSHCFYRVWCCNCITFHSFFLLFQRPRSRFLNTIAGFWILLHFWCIPVCGSNSRKILSGKVWFVLSIPPNIPLLCGSCRLRTLSKHTRNSLYKNLWMKMYLNMLRFVTYELLLSKA